MVDQSIGPSPLDLGQCYHNEPFNHASWIHPCMVLLHDEQYWRKETFSNCISSKGLTYFSDDYEHTRMPPTLTGLRNSESSYDREQEGSEEEGPIDWNSHVCLKVSMSHQLAGSQDLWGREHLGKKKGSWKSCDPAEMTHDEPWCWSHRGLILDPFIHSESRSPTTRSSPEGSI
jgi:hypothetical protein